MPQPRRVVLVTTHYPPLVGGAATYFSLLAQALHGAGAEVTVLTTRAPGFPAVSEEHGIVVWRRIPRLDGAPELVRKTMQAASTVRWLAALRAPRRPDVIHTHASKSVTLGSAVASELLRIPVVYDVQDFFSRPAVIRRGTRPRYVATGRAVADRLAALGISADRWLTIPSIPADAARHGRSRADRREPGCRFLFIGELHHAVKGSDVLLKAFAQVRKRNMDATLTIVGDGPDRAADEAYVRSAGLGGAVTFMGILPPAAVDDAIADADALVVSSRSEAMPRVILEAFASGAPVIATRVGGIAEAVRDDETGLLVAPNDAEALSAAMERLAGDATLRARLGAAGRNWVEQLPTWDRLGAAIIALYE